MEEADIVVVGAGPGGCAAAARLSDDPRRTVRVLEAGGILRDWRTRASGRVAPPLDPANWTRASIAQPGLAGRRAYLPAGRGLGGSSAIGWGLYWRGEAAGYDQWAAAGCPGWSWDAVRPHLLAAEANRRGASAWHGAHGPVPVTDPRLSAGARAFLGAAAAAGEPLAADLNGADPIGASPFQVMRRGGERWSAARAFLDPLRHRPNLSVTTGATAERVLFEGGRAWGVAYRRDGEERVCRARGVVLAAGAFGTPHLLMLSGIGPGRELVGLGVPLRIDRPAVGADLQDVAMLAMPYGTAGGPFGEARARPGAGAVLRWWWGRRGPLATAPIEAGVTLRAGTLDAPAEAALLFTAWPEDDGARAVAPGRGFTLRVAALRPFSRGRVRLAALDPRRSPLIDAGLLADRRDVATLAWAREAAVRIVAADPIARHRPVDRFAIEAAEADAVERLLRARVESGHQPAGTARMGSDEEAVCDPRLAVRGVAGLWVADASVMPRLVPGGVAAAAMIGARCAGFIADALRG